jgi:hypothetical protein
MSKRSSLAPYAAAAVLATLYIATLAPSVAGGDSGELTAAALTGGVPHPSGYPLFAILVRGFGALPLGHSPAWRANLLSAVSTAAAGGLVCSVVQSWTRNARAGLLAAALFGTSTLVWSHATSAEVFGLNAMFVALAFHLWLRVERSLARRDVCALLVEGGLAMCNHLTFVFVGAPLVVRSLWVARRRLGASGFAMALFFGLVGLTPYIYLMSASGSAAAISWGNETSVAGLVAHFLRRDYGTFSMGRADSGGAFLAEGTFLPTLWTMCGGAFPRLLWGGPVLAAAGVVVGLRNRQTRDTISILVFTFGLYTVTFCALANITPLSPIYPAVIGRFCIESDLMLALASGLGFDLIEQRLGLQDRWPRVAPLGVVLLFLVGVAAHWRQADRRNDYVYRDFVTTAFTSLPPSAVVLTNMGDDVTGAAFYMHEVEKLRPDVIHWDPAYLGTRWYVARQRRLHRDVVLPDGEYGIHGWNINQLLEANPGRPLYVIGHMDDWDGSWQDGYRFIAYGLSHALVRPSEVPPYEEWVVRDRQALGAYDVTPALRAPEGSWERGLAQRVLDSQVGRAHLALVYGSKRADGLDMARRAQALLEDVVAKSGGDAELGISGQPEIRRLPTNSDVWQNLGLAYEVLSRVDDAYVSRFAVTCERFIERAESTDPDLPAARKFLDQWRGRQSRPRLHGGGSDGGLPQRTGP